MVVSEPFATAYGIGEFHGTIVVDIGAGTTDIARLYGTFPSDDDQISIAEAASAVEISSDAAKSGTATPDIASGRGRTTPPVDV